MTEQPIDADAVTAAIDDAQAVTDLQRYFRSYTGRRFERLAGGGDRDEVRDHVTAEDLVAVSLLSVPIPGEAAIDLLEGRAAEITDLLRDVPAGLDLGAADDDVIGPDAPADRLWCLLTSVTDIGPVTAGKLLARKRPRLVPVYDSVVQAVLGRQDGDGYWRPLRDLLRDDPDVGRRLSTLRSEAKVGDDISLIRILDVVLWMRGKGDRSTP